MQSKCFLLSGPRITFCSLVFAAVSCRKLRKNKGLYRLTPVVLVLVIFLAVSAASAQTPAPRIAASIEGTALTRLKGNTHPLAQTRFDQGVADPSTLLANHAGVQDDFSSAG
jgi:hypothetical protein